MEMKSKMLMSIIAAGLVSIGCANIYVTLGNTNSSDVQPVQIEEELFDKKYKEAQDAINGIHDSIEVIYRNDDDGKITLSIYNPSNYKFSSLMLDVEFVNSNGEAYYYETVFLTEGLVPSQLRVVEFDVTDLKMLEDVDYFNFFIQGY